MNFGIVALLYIAIIVTFVVTVSAILLVRASNGRGLMLGFLASLATNTVLTQPWAITGFDDASATLPPIAVLTVLGFCIGGVAAITLRLLFRR